MINIHKVIGFLYVRNPLAQFLHLQLRMHVQIYVQMFQKPTAKWLSMFYACDKMGNNRAVENTAGNCRQVGVPIATQSRGSLRQFLQHKQ